MYNPARLLATPCVHAKLLSHVPLCVTPWTVAHQAPLCLGFSRQEYWSGLPCLPPRDLPDPGIEPALLLSHALAGGFFTTSTTWEVTLLPQGPSKRQVTGISLVVQWIRLCTSIAVGMDP